MTSTVLPDFRSPSCKKLGEKIQLHILNEKPVFSPTILISCSVNWFLYYKHWAAVAELLVHLSTMTEVRIQSLTGEGFIFWPAATWGRPSLNKKWVPDNFRGIGWNDKATRKRTGHPTSWPRTHKGDSTTHPYMYARTCEGNSISYPQLLA